MNASGFPRSEVSIIDVSTLVNSALKGVTGVIGITEWGETNKRVLVGSWEEYKRSFGGLRSDTQFPWICKRALDAGATLVVNRIGRYTTISNPSTLQGTRASGTLATAATPLTINLAVAGAGGSFRVATDVTAVFFAGRTFTVTGSTGNDGNYTVASSTFATGNTTIVVVGTVPAASATGSINYSSASITYTAKSIGPWANTVTVTTAPAASGQTNFVDVLISNSKYPELDQLIRDFSRTPTSTQIDTFNAQSLYVTVGNIIGTIPNTGTTVLTGGVENISAITNTDYIGDPASSTGLYAFDDDTDIIHLAVPEKADNVIDVALSTYVAARKDIIGFIRTPFGLIGNTVVAYREQTTPYSGTAIDNYLMMMFTGGIRANEPLSKLPQNVSELGDVIAAAARTDTNAYEWFSFAGPKRGKVYNAIDVVYNFGSTGHSGEADLIYNRGVNAVINESTMGVLVWGNATLQRAATRLRKANIAKLLVFLRRTLKPIAQSELFEPNDPQTWQNIYQKVKKVLDFVKTNRGIYDFRYEGDQDVDRIQDVVVNQLLDIQAGLYKARIFIQPTATMEYIGFELIITDIDVDLALLDPTQI